MRIWRISNFADLSGRGGIVSAGRWNPKATPMVYCSDHPATALLEILVHIDAHNLPPTYQLLEIEVPDSVSIASPDLTASWQSDLSGTQQLGAMFVSANATAIMRVPCLIVPFASNYLLNPALLERDGIRIASVTSHPIDARVLP
ncbi:RES family NAD+ phosphorylase [Mesorhizobium sp. YM1C-6-2]|uniref:RES family NAD+ phosphorylase n=1 Tax=Mesorhizobium sp. YM1C-6-2 TaxID=1827501 RepID=UPI000EF22FF0|nr:RES family NAD+ phosphorylase [Mesorhizobium sp. YM1C-6-2]RLP22327.1 RES domain-containing protein [Mesorhizobium sp. YM1C-6-2]